MTNDKPQEKRVVGNLGVLDLRRASDESFSTVSVIGNLGVVLYSPETAHLLSRINSVIGNLGRYIEAPQDARVHVGDIQFTRHYFKGKTAGIDLVVLGRVVVDPDLPAEDVGKGLGELIVTGDLICPDHLAGPRRRSSTRWAWTWRVPTSAASACPAGRAGRRRSRPRCGG